MLRLKVTGMTCNHCVQAVAKAVGSAAPGAAVEVSLETGEVGIAGPADAGRVIAAIVDAGYEAAPLAR